MDSVAIIGTSGAFLILVAFIMNQLKKWKEDYLIYDLINFVGSALLVAYAIILKSYPFLVLNSVWALLSLRDIVVDLQRNTEKRRGGFFTKWMK